MFAKTIIDSDAFLDMPTSSQCLYFHLSMRADDDGFINNPKKIQRIVGCSDDDLRLLIAKRFIIPFESGVVVIKHWKIHNYIQKDRYKPTVYQEEKQLLDIKDNGAYTLRQDEIMDTKCIQDGYGLETQVRLGKVSIGKDRLGKDNLLPYGSTSEQSPDLVEEIIAFYNAHRNRMPEAKTLSNKRKGYINARLDNYGLDTVKEVILKAEASDFLNGGGNKGWIAPGIDWLMRTENFPEVLEGLYDNRHQNEASNNPFL